MPEFPEKILYAGSPPLIVEVGAFGCIATGAFAFEPLHDEQPPDFAPVDGCAGVGTWVTGVVACVTGYRFVGGIVPGIDMALGIGLALGIGIVGGAVGCGNVPKKLVAIIPVVNAAFACRILYHYAIWMDRCWFHLCHRHRNAPLNRSPPPRTPQHRRHRTAHSPMRPKAQRKPRPPLHDRLSEDR